jgi:2-polyprenyl-3-methyl-5-hydroxy-6-metoxy-1,4-benzoquinol methylase
VSGHPRATLEERLAPTRGASGDAVYALAQRTLDKRGAYGGTLVDTGCGSGALLRLLRGRFDALVGIDAVRYDGIPADVRFVEHDLNEPAIPLESGCAQVVAALEVIEHLENPRAFVRELARLVAPGGWLLVSTPNQLSLLSKGTLVVKNRFNAFQDGAYPVHVTALLEVDLLRIAREAGLVDAQTEYTQRGRLPLSSVHYPRALSRRFPRALSDNVLLIARKPASTDD